MFTWSWLFNMFFKVKCSFCGESYMKAHKTCPNCTREIFEAIKEQENYSDDPHGGAWEVFSDPIANPDPHPYFFGLTEDGRPVISPDEEDWWYVYGED